MDDSIPVLMNILWGALISYWFISGFNAKKSISRESVLMRFALYWLPLFVAIYLLGPDDRFGNTLVKGNFIPHDNRAGVTGLVLALAGLILACRARYLLGKNWSVSVQQKENHELISRGVYKIIRHPIYSGLLLMFTGNAVIAGCWRGPIAFAILFISFWFKLLKEEKYMVDLFGNQYLEYKSRTKALIPWII